ncbi:MAG TPA: DUF4349 domain-containing protein [Gaiellaceae bacterium]|nr:DUF4349 domain-containing protein [Gaiellaceae bacterium]
MSPRDVLAELREAQVAAPADVRERVRLLAAADPTTPARRFTWKRSLVVALPVAAAIAGAFVLTRPSHHVKDQLQLAKAPPVLSTQIQHGSAAAPAFVPSARSRVQIVGTTLSLRIPNAQGVSDAVKRAVQITTSLSGYASSVHEQTHGKTASADLTLKVPRAHVQQAVSRLSQLGTITAEQVSVTDKQAGLNATDREIARLQKQLAATTGTKQRAALTSHIQSLQRSEAQLRRAAHYATIHLTLATPPAPAKTRHHGPLHGVGVALRWLGIGAVYALAIGLPVAIVLALCWFAIRLIRRRREEALLGR